MIDINKLPDISTHTILEENFKIFAGPGAGKTTWLINHLKYVLKNSTRLGKTRRIACITYTNVAAEEIMNKLQCDKNRFIISTIHSFLYQNIIKPFLYLIAKDENDEVLFNINQLNGHEEHIVQGDRYRRWISTIEKLNKKKYNIYNSPEKKSKVINELSSLDYIFNDDQVDLIIRQNRGARLPKSNGELWIYKSKYWKDGIMHHEDVLYFSYLIISKSSRVLEFVRNKFPYIYIDEFQDTTELQTWLINKISEVYTKVGIVGDIAQSIYKFTGAKRSDFLAFKKNEINEYKLNRNHRSTFKIIDFLNLMRTDIKQEYGEKTHDGNKILVLIGSIQSAKKWYEKNNQNKILYILTRKNSSVSLINDQLEVISTDLMKDLFASDSNSARVKIIHSIIIGFKYYLKNDYCNSIKEIVKQLKKVSTNILKLELKKIAIHIIDSLKLEINANVSILAFYNALRQKIFDEYNFYIGSSFRNGKAKTFYESNELLSLLPYVKVDVKSDDIVRTIHSAKGKEFENVLVHFDSTEDFRKYILNSVSYIADAEDDCRIYYVACSRAKENLIFNIPSATEEDLKSFEKMNIDYKKIP